MVSGTTCFGHTMYSEVFIFSRAGSLPFVVPACRDTTSGSLGTFSPPTQAPPFEEFQERVSPLVFYMVNW